MYIKAMDKTIVSDLFVQKAVVLPVPKTAICGGGGGGGGLRLQNAAICHVLRTFCEMSLLTCLQSSGSPTQRHLNPNKLPRSTN